MCNSDLIPRVPSTTNTKKGTNNRSRADDSANNRPNTMMQQQQHHHHHHQEAATELMAASVGATTTKERAAMTTMKDAAGGNHTLPFSTVTYMLLGTVASAIVTLFSLYLPFWQSPEAASKTYHLAFFEYTEDKHHFDITAWTYGTDYGLATVMVLWCVSMLYQRAPRTTSSHASGTSTTNANKDRLVKHIWGLLGGYAMSTLAGALSHNYYTTLEQRQTWHFRMLWTVCVGTVTFASASMGCIGSEMVRQFQPHTPGRSLPFVPEVFWNTYGVITTIFATFGWFSYQRPACDVFIAGITQFPSSFYVISILWQVGRQSPHLLHARYQVMGMLSFIANAPLLPLYPLLVQHTNWDLAQVNTFLHSWILVAWSTQAFSIRHVRRAVLMMQQRPAKAVPMKKDS